MIYDDCVISYSSNVKTQNIDSFSHIWWDNSYMGKCYKMHFKEKYPNENLGEKMSNSFSLHKINVEKSRGFEIDFIQGFDKNTWGDYDKDKNWIPLSLSYYRMMTPILLLSLMSQTYAAYQSFLLARHSLNYDVCVRSRVDIVYTKPLRRIIEKLPIAPNRIFFQSSLEGGHLYAGEFANKPCDWFFAADESTMNVFLEAWHYEISNAFKYGLTHTNDYVKKICHEKNLEIYLVDFGALIYKQTNDYYSRYLNRIEIYMNDFNFIEFSPSNLDIWPYWITDVDFKKTQNLSFI
jgi:hypothetical protein